TWAETGAVTVPVIVQPTLATEPEPPEEPALPLIVLVVQATAPPTAGAARRTAKPAAGPGAAAWAAMGHAPTRMAKGTSQRIRTLKAALRMFVLLGLIWTIRTASAAGRRGTHSGRAYFHS